MREKPSIHLLILLMFTLLFSCNEQIGLVYAQVTRIEEYEWKWTLLIQAHSPKYGRLRERLHGPINPLM